MMELSTKIFSDLKRLTILKKTLIADVWQGSKYLYTQPGITCSKSTIETLQISCSNLTIKTPERRQWRVLVFLLLTLSM